MCVSAFLHLIQLPFYYAVWMPPVVVFHFLVGYIGIKTKVIGYISVVNPNFVFCANKQFFQYVMMSACHIVAHLTTYGLALALFLNLIFCGPTFQETACWRNIGPVTLIQEINFGLMTACSAPIIFSGVPQYFADQTKLIFLLKFGSVLRGCTWIARMKGYCSVYIHNTMDEAQPFMTNQE
jgi:hypothetical protein